MSPSIENKGNQLLSQADKQRMLPNVKHHRNTVDNPLFAEKQVTEKNWGFK